MTTNSQAIIGAALALAFLTASSIGCARQVRRYSAEGPMWRDAGDFKPFGPVPEAYFSPFAWDAADNMIFRPLARIFAVDPGGEAVNVNSMDEVPDSSWFTNRLNRQRLSPERIAQAACDDAPLDPSGPWTITSAKPDGASPGFIIKDQQGRSFLLKFGDENQRERATTADVVGSIFYWAAGYEPPCNQITFFRKDILQIGENATATVYGKKVPLTWERLDPVFDLVSPQPDGTWRAAASRFLPGKPLGPWRYELVRDDDPNDVIPHDDRRELRGAYVLASWINHFDSREQNTLSMWITTDDHGRGYVRHHYIDFGDSFGSMWALRGMSERLGHTYYLDMPYVFQDLVTFGGIPRAWRGNELGPTGNTFGYYNVETFQPDKYRTGYQNPAFIRATERDKAWMARIIANITPEAIEAAVARAKLSDPFVESELLRIVLARREKILQRWFRNLSPLAEPRLHEAESGTELCLRDLAVATGIVEPDARLYSKRGWRHVRRRKLREVEVGAPRRGPNDTICVGLPNIDRASLDHPAYLIIDVNGLYGRDDDKSRPARVHLYQFGKDAYLIVGLQRPYKLRTPSGLDQYYPRSLEMFALDLY